MFGISKRLRQRADIKRLKKRAEADPYPRSYVELCKALVSYGDRAGALEMAQEGLAQFPHCEDLRDVLRRTWRQTQSGRIDAVRARCSEAGEVRDFVELVRMYLECEEYEEALGVAEELTRRFPNDEEGCLLQGEILLRRFYKDHVASDARRGIVCLQQVIEASDRSFRGHFLLSEIYSYIGAVSKALFHIYRALDINPEHEPAQGVYEELIKQPLEKQEESVLLRRLEENDEDARGGPLRGETRAALVADLMRLSLLNGVKRAAFVNDEVALVAERGECRALDETGTDPLCDMARGFRKAAAVSSRRMGIGAFQASTLSAGQHMLQFHAAGRTVVLVESDEPSRSDVIRAECANFVASCLRTAGGVVHA